MLSDVGCKVLDAHRENWMQASLPVRAPVHSPTARSCAADGRAVARLTTKRHSRLATSAGKIASRCASAAGTCPRTQSVSQNTVHTVPAAIDVTAPAAVARLQ